MTARLRRPPSPAPTLNHEEHSMTSPAEATTDTPSGPFRFANRGPLEGLVVLDFTTQLSGPLVTYHLASLGATVLKIEDPKGGDRVRAYMPFISPDGSVTSHREHPDALSLPTLNRTRGKHSITLNLKSPEARAIYRELACRADIVVENYAGGTADSLGIGYEATRAINPRIIYCSVSGFGAGSMQGRKAMDGVIQAMSGLMMTSGEDGDPPVRVGMTIADSVAPLYAVMGINAALYRRERSGAGEYVDISMLGALTAFIAVEDWQAMERLGNKTRTGNSLVRASPFGVFQCSDGYISIAAGGQDHNAHALFRLMGRPEMASDPRYATLPERSQRDDELTALVNAWCGGQTVEDVEQALLHAGIPVSKVRTPAEALEDPMVNERREVVNATHPELGPLPGLKTYGLPIRLHSATYGHGAAAPRLGEDNDLIYRDWLGLGEDRLAALRAVGAF